MSPAGRVIMEFVVYILMKYVYYIELGEVGKE